MGMALSWMPPCIVALVGFWCFLAMLMPPPSELSTITLLRSGKTCATSPRLPMSLPWMTCTWSPFLSFIFGLAFVAMLTTPPVRATRCAMRNWCGGRAASSSQHLRRERNDAHEPPVAQLAAHRAEDARAAGLHLLVDQH